MYHATDKNRSALDLYYETKEVSDPTKSHTMIVCLKVADISYLEVIDRYVRAVPLMNPYKIPRGEPVWTCRVWVKEALKNLHAARVIRLPASLGKISKVSRQNIETHKYRTTEKIEKCGIYTADKVVPYRRPNKGQRPRLEKPSMYNDLDWLSQNISPTVPMDIDSVQDHPVQERYYGPKPMITDMTTQAPKRPYYGAKPMITDSNHQSTVQPNHYGTTPMMIDSTGYYTSSSRRAY